VKTNNIEISRVMKQKRIFLGIGLLIAIGGLLLYILGIRPALVQNTAFEASKKVLFVPSGTQNEQLEQILLRDSFVADLSSFQRTALVMRFNRENIRPGRYNITKGMTNRALVGKLRSGAQDAQKVVINNIRLVNDLAGKASRYFESDSLAFLQYLTDPATSTEYQFSQEKFLTMFLPNTYEMFWTTTPEKFVARMKKEYDDFWTKERLDQLQKNGLDPTKAYILASIVEKESNYNPERPTIAGVYLNRLKSGEKLQADPTVVFATGDFTIQRVLYEHLKTESPYNTYLYAGLPPGPICMPSMASLEAVIHAENHDYFFFCAKADNSGIHAFAKDYGSHLKNAEAFANWLNSRKIK